MVVGELMSSVTFYSLLDLVCPRPFLCRSAGYRGTCCRFKRLRAGTFGGLLTGPSQRKSLGSPCETHLIGQVHEGITESGTCRPRVRIS